ncbi:MAG: TonB family protein, partial [Xanthobacteraceae bacterium]|nr:TonB family protein [Xanthobacteraceae bacterium]
IEFAKLEAEVVRILQQAKTDAARSAQTPPPQPASEVPAPQPRPAQHTEAPAPVRHDTPATIARPRAPKTSAPPKAQHVAAIASTAAAGVSAAAATASYDAQVAAHLQRFKQYPSGARAAGEQGTAVLTFTVSRSGQVLSSHLGRSSGSAALDAETLALLRRAQPLPPFPPEMPQASKTLSVPLSYSLR